MLKVNWIKLKEIQKANDTITSIKNNLKSNPILAEITEDKFESIEEFFKVLNEIFQAETQASITKLIGELDELKKVQINSLSFETHEGLKSEYNQKCCKGTPNCDSQLDWWRHNFEPEYFKTIGDI